jgi:hypothetical protein
MVSEQVKRTKSLQAMMMMMMMNKKKKMMMMIMMIYAHTELHIVAYEETVFFSSTRIFVYCPSKERWHLL